ncbi:hypothetical protein [Pseudofrankia sp. BMG5.36]|uniref:type II secretion system F family protein n=1 Tax=Pseudofrankia sp. BMG5.36 TaxID=1834512 RepID=UPI0008D9F4B0|nr:hypothetical protein [Pseudofrankia sp. BMG5.36]OHV64191.1 hypothetical protein BCD48_37730 [Pseudofrankia sp. BMG5.36]
MSGVLRLLALAGDGAVAGAGLWLLAAALTGRAPWTGNVGVDGRARWPRHRGASGSQPTTLAARNTGAAIASRWRALPRSGPVAVAALVGLVVGALVGLPVLAVIAAGLVWLAREARTLRGVGETNELGEAVATWCETVRQELDAGQPLRAAVAASSELPPSALAGPLAALGRRLHDQQSLPWALAAFRRDVAHPAVGQVVTALVLAYRHGAGDLGRLMASQVETTRHRVAVLRDLHAGRARHRRAMTLLLALFALTTGGLLVAWPAVLTPYHTAAGQLALTGLLALVGVAVHSLIRRSRPPAMPDFFEETT